MDFDRFRDSEVTDTQTHQCRLAPVCMQAGHRYCVITVSAAVCCEERKPSRGQRLSLLLLCTATTKIFKTSPYRFQLNNESFKGLIGV